VDHLIDFRRELHRHPEPAWREFYTTGRIVEELERIGIDEVRFGRAIHDEDRRKAVPDTEEIAHSRDYAEELGVPGSLLDRMDEGYTGAIGVLERGAGPTVALRVDIDGLERTESREPNHRPASEGFRSERDGMMHACGHDAHATIGVGVLERMAETEFEGTLKVLFQPGEEKGAGALPMAHSGHLDDVDYLVAIHVGMRYPTGTVVPAVDSFFAASDARVEFAGGRAHAGSDPAAGRNAVRAMAMATEKLHGLPRHFDAVTRVNVAPVGGGTATNVIPASAFMEFEVRSDEDDGLEHMEDRAERIVESSANRYDCEVDVEWKTRLPSGTCDEAVVDVVESVARRTDTVDAIETAGEPSGSEDATVLMQYVRNNGGKAAYVGIGCDHPGGHHTPLFDVDEEVIPIGVTVLERTIGELASRSDDDHRR
jgi:aminobenzoyl-glutamate utilization protein A